MNSGNVEKLANLESTDSPDGLIRVLSPEGVLTGNDDVPMSDDMAIDALKLMMLSRISDARLISLQRQGRMGTFSPVHGQEAAVVGSCFAIDPSQDWIVPAYREMPAMIRQGLPLERFLSYWKGSLAGGRIPDGVRLLPVQIALGAQLPHAVGLAWGRRLMGTDEVVLTYFGDGASSEGDFHEAMNLAGVVSAPVIFVLQNNGWAISTPRTRQSAATTFASRAEGYGFPGVLVDGNDLFAVYRATQDAVARARSGAGPTLLELQTIRMGAHNTADDPTRYRQHDDSWAESDPILRVTRYLEGKGVWEAAKMSELEESINHELDVAIEVAEASGPPQIGEIFDNVYFHPTTRMTSQRERAETEWGGQ